MRKKRHHLMFGFLLNLCDSFGVNFQKFLQFREDCSRDQADFRGSLTGKKLYLKHLLEPMAVAPDPPHLREGITGYHSTTCFSPPSIFPKYSVSRRWRRQFVKGKLPSPTDRKASGGITQNSSRSLCF